MVAWCEIALPSDGAAAPLVQGSSVPCVNEAVFREWVCLLGV